MPQYKVEHYNAESGMLHSSHVIYAADEETAKQEAGELVAAENGYGVSADGRQVTAITPHFRVSVTEME